MSRYSTGIVSRGTNGFSNQFTAFHTTQQPSIVLVALYRALVLGNTLITRPFQHIIQWFRNSHSSLSALKRTVLHFIGRLLAHNTKLPRLRNYEVLTGNVNTDMSNPPNIKGLRPYIFHRPVYSHSLFQHNAGLLFTYISSNYIVTKFKQSRDATFQQIKKIPIQMANSKNYFEWSSYAAKLQALHHHQSSFSSSSSSFSTTTKNISSSRSSSPSTKSSPLYDIKLLETKLSHLRNVRAKGTITDCMLAVRADLIRNLGGITSAGLHRHYSILPKPIQEYINEVCTHLKYITNSPSDFSDEEKKQFLNETRHAFGRTGLFLSGGGAISGGFHLGVVKALLDESLIPRVLAGCDVGAIVAALAATRSNSELAWFFKASSLSGLEPLLFTAESIPLLLAKLMMLLPGGSSVLNNNKSSSNISSCSGVEQILTDQDLRSKRLRQLLGDLTFAEAYQKTGKMLNLFLIPVSQNTNTNSDNNSHHQTSDPPRLFNHLSTPHIAIWSAVTCSIAPPPIISPPPYLYTKTAHGQFVIYSAGATKARRWRDGTAYDAHPMRGLSEMFQVNHLIISQTSPVLVPLLNARAAAGPMVGTLMEGEIRHRCRQILDVLPCWATPTAVGGVLRALARPWEGDVTIVPPAASCTLGLVLGRGGRGGGGGGSTEADQQQKKDLAAAIRAGELATWGSLSAIQCNCAIEETLDKCIHKLTMKERARKKKKKMEMEMEGGAIGLGIERGGGGGGEGGGLAAHQQLTMPSPASAPSLRDMHNNNWNNSVGDGGMSTSSQIKFASRGNLPQLLNNNNNNKKTKKMVAKNPYLPEEPHHHQKKDAISSPRAEGSTTPLTITAIAASSSSIEKGPSEISASPSHYDAAEENLPLPAEEEGVDTDLDDIKEPYRYCDDDDDVLSITVPAGSIFSTRNDPSRGGGGVGGRKVYYPSAGIQCTDTTAMFRGGGGGGGGGENNNNNDNVGVGGY